MSEMRKNRGSKFFSPFVEPRIISILIIVIAHICLNHSGVRALKKTFECLSSLRAIEGAQPTVSGRN